MKTAFYIDIINGPNLNMLGKREKSIYGTTTLEEINNLVTEEAQHLGASVSFFQSNSEGGIIDHIHSLQKTQGIIINPGAFTHTSVAIRDALSAISIPTVEVHLSNIHAREEFRKHSFIAPVCIGQICGFGPYSYTGALQVIVSYLKNN